MVRARLEAFVPKFVRLDKAWTGLRVDVGNPGMVPQRFAALRSLLEGGSTGAFRTPGKGDQGPTSPHLNWRYRKSPTLCHFGKSLE